MRFMILVKGNEESEAGVLPSAELVAAMGRYNESLAKAGVLLALDGLHDSSKGARVAFSGDKRTVIDGPFAESKELVAGYWLIQAKSLEEAVEWVKRAPFQGGEVEVRQVFETSDFPEEIVPPEQAQRESELRESLARNAANG